MFFSHGGKSEALHPLSKIKASHIIMGTDAPRDEVIKPEQG